MIYKKMIELKTSNINESSAMTLMGTDVERIAETLPFFCDIWAYIIQLCVAVWLLERELGAVCVVPAIIALGWFYIQTVLSPKKTNEPFLHHMGT